jgi:septum formation protein
MKPREISKERPLLLGSGSPRRREILLGLGLPIEVRPANTDEEVGLSDPAALLQRVVDDKRAAVVANLGAERERFAALLVADTIVVCHGEILGKPRDTAHAEQLLHKLAGQTHTVFTRYAIQREEEIVAHTVASQVTMRQPSAEVLRRYAESGEGLDKAGAYAIQGLGAFLVRSIEGSYSNVVGLPACEVVEQLERLGLLPLFPAF